MAGSCTWNRTSGIPASAGVSDVPRSPCASGPVACAQAAGCRNVAVAVRTSVAGPAEAGGTGDRSAGRAFAGPAAVRGADLTTDLSDGLRSAADMVSVAAAPPAVPAETEDVAEIVDAPAARCDWAAAVPVNVIALPRVDAEPAAGRLDGSARGR